MALTKAKIKRLLKRGKKNATPPKIKRQKKYIPKKPSEVTSSKIELIFGQVLINNGINVKSQFQLGYKFFDFYIPNTKILIEFHGSYFHASKDLYESKDLNGMQKKNILNDAFKKNLAVCNGYKLIVVWEHHFKTNPTKEIKRVKDFVNIYKDFPSI